MEDNHLSPTNNADISKDDLTIVSHINELPVSAVFSNKNSNGELIMSAEEIESFIGSFPPGFRFFPTDDELITHYLERKIGNLRLEPNKIYEMNIYKYDPETIAAHVKPTTEEKVWYIFTPRDRKYQNGHRPNRSAGNGYWKATGADKPIKDDKNVIVGVRKALVYYYGKAPKGQKTNWIMHEYRLPGVPDISERGPKDLKLDDWVLCRLYNRNDMDKTVFTQRKRSRENYELVIDEVKDTHDENLSSPQLHEPVCEVIDADSTRNDLINYEYNFNQATNPVCEVIDADSTRNDLTNYEYNFNQATNLVCEVIDADSTRNDLTNYEYNFNQATIFHPQVPVGLCPFPQCTYMPAFCNCLSWVPPQFDNGGFAHGDDTSMTNNVYHHQIAPAPMMIEPISSMMPTTNSIGYDHDSMQHQGFDVSFFTSCIGGGPDEEYLELRRDPMDEFLVNNDELDAISSEYNTNNFVNGEINKPREDC